MLSDGEYTVDVDLQGGSGKASIKTPTKLSVKDGKMQAEVEWSSSHYDYMEVDNKEYYPVNTNGNSLFLIDVSELDTDISVKAETLAMSQPHMIEYTISFDSSTIKSENAVQSELIVACAGVVILVTALVTFFIGKKKLNDKK